MDVSTARKVELLFRQKEYDYIIKNYLDDAIKRENNNEIIYYFDLIFNEYRIIYDKETGKYTVENLGSLL